MQISRHAAGLRPNRADVDRTNGILQHQKDQEVRP